MVGSGHVDKGAIYSIAGDSKWAGSAGFEVRSRIPLASHLSLVAPEDASGYRAEMRLRGNGETYANVE